MLATIVAAVLASAPPSIDAKADAILSEARAYVAQRSYPNQLAYHVVVTLRSDDGTTSSRTYDDAFEIDRNLVYAHSISEEENRNPFVPTGIDVVASLSGSTSTGSTGTSIQLNRPADDPDVLGVPMLSPTYTFGLARLTSPSATDVTPGLRIIGRVHAVTRDYYATYLGDETVAGESCAHLRLTPVQHPEQYRLRELWVAADGAPLRAVTHGNFTTRPWDGLDWIVTFRRDASALYIDSEATRDRVRVDRFRKGHVVVSFTDVATSDVSKRFFLSLEPGVAVREP